MKAAPARTMSREMISQWWPILGLLVLTLGLIGPLWRAGDSPPGIDIFGHLFKPWYMANTLAQQGFIPQWLPHWYNGAHLTQYYPPLSYLALVPLHLMMGGIFEAHPIFIGLCVWGAGCFAYLLARRWLPPVAAFVSAGIFTFAPYNQMVMFWEGNLPRTLAMVFMPLVVHLAVAVLETPRKWTGVALTVSLVLLVLAHHMPALATLIALVPFTLAYTYLKHISQERVLRVGLWLGAGLLLSAFWLVPATTHIDLERAPNLSSLPERIGQYSVGLNMLDPRDRLERNAYLSLAVLGISAVGLFLGRPKPLQWASLLAVVTSIFFALGRNNPLFPVLPLLRYWFPERFLQVTILFLGLLAGSTLAAIRPVRWRALASLLAPVLLVIDFAPNLILRHVTPEEQAQRQAVTRLSHWLAGRDNDGRVLVQAPINWDTAFAPYSIGGKEQNYGWAPEGSPISLSATEINLSLRLKNTVYPQRLFALWDTRYAVLDPLIADQDRLAEALKQAGWSEVNLDLPWRLLYTETPSQRFFYQDRDILVIGRGAVTAARTFPWLAQGVSQTIDDYTLDYLEQFRGILLYDYKVRSQSQAEALLQSLVDRGIQVWIDLQFQEGKYLFGVEPTFAEINGPASLQVDPSMPLSIRNIPSEETSPIPWRGFYPFSEDARVLVELDTPDWHYPVLVQKEVGRAKITFIGLSLTTRATLQNDLAAREILESLLDQVQPNKAFSPRPLAVSSAKWGAQSLQFSYQAETKTPALISMTFTPHWRAYVDHKAVQVYNHEDLCLVWLPAGEHSVEFKFGPSPAQRIGLGLSVIGMIIVVITFALKDKFLAAGANWLSNLIWRRDEP